MRDIIVEQKETVWYRTTFIVPIDISDLEFIEMLKNNDNRLLELDSEGNYLPGSGDPLTIQENALKPTLEVKLGRYDEPIWNNVEGLLTDD